MNTKNDKVHNPYRGLTQYGWHFEQNLYFAAMGGCIRTLKSCGGSGDIPKITLIYQINSNMKPYTFTVIDKDGKAKKCVALVRKLTSAECFTLMGCDKPTTEILTDTQKTGVSKCQQYKQAGNSIVVDVLYHMFRKMWIEPGNEGKQMSIFDVL